MKLLLQLVLCVTLFAGLYCRRGRQEKEVKNEETEVLEASFYGLDETEREATEEETTTTAWRRGGGGRGGKGSGRKHRGQPHHEKMWQGFKDMTPEQKLDKVCSELESPRSRGHAKHMADKMSRLEPEVRDQITTLIANRKTQMLECCKMEVTERVQCATDYHKERYNRVCNKKEPLCVWALLKGTTSQTSATVDKCCALQGDERVDCFTAARPQFKQNKWQKKKHFIV